MIRTVEEPKPPWYCVDCGVRLNEDHAYCWNCGAQRWRPPEAEAAATPTAPTPTPAPHSEPSRWTPPPRLARQPAAAPRLGALRFFFAFWAVMLLVWATYATAVLLSPDGRAQLSGAAVGVSPGEAVTLEAFVVAAAVLAAGLHGVAYYGIRARRVSGWLVGVVVAGLWSLVLVGIPALWLLLQRSTREAFGLA